MDDLHTLLDSAMMRRLQQLLDREPQAIVSLVDPDHRIVWADEARAEAIYGRRSTDYESQPIDAFLPAPEAERFRAAIQTAFAGHTATYAGATLAADGSTRRARTVLWPTSDHRFVVVISLVAPPDAES
ncbi:MAG: PAS domain-containing protein [Nitriliruptoraceae bacterium]|nr:PAS domain-containing protein [Nitriliruptoraceae bacterium]